MHLLISMFRYRAHIDTPPTSFCVGGGGVGVVVVMESRVMVIHKNKLTL